MLLSAGFADAAPLKDSDAAKLAETAMNTLWQDSLRKGPAPRKWTYDQSVVLLGIEGLWYRTADPKYFDYMQRCMDRFVDENGRIDTYEQNDFNIDNVACGRILLALYKVTGKERYYKAAATLREQLEKHPRTKSGSFWHKKIYQNQVWLDGLYMAQPFYAEWSKTYGPSSAFDDIAGQFMRIEQTTRDAKTGLMRHGWDESRSIAWADSATGLSPNVWARAMGWYGAALVDVLDYFPQDHPKRKELIGILGRFATALQKSQDAKSGLWWDVMNAPYPGMKPNYFEASAASQFVYMLAKSVRLGYIDAGFRKTALKGYEGIRREFLHKDEAGATHLDGTVSVSGLGGKPFRDGSFEYYMKEKVIRNDAKGVGAFIQAANEIETIDEQQIGKGKTIILDSYFNDEHDKDIQGNVRSSHYKWDERSNGGFQFWDRMLTRYGAATSTLYKAPDAAALKGAAGYIIVDPDIPKENADAKFMDERSAVAIADWVKNGGRLILLLNDSGNCDLSHMNILTKKFGFSFREDSRNHVEGRKFEQGALFLNEQTPVFKTARKVYLKEISTIDISDAAKVKTVFKDKGDVLMVEASHGKGKVFAVGDPWIYNEYVDGRKLPADFENFKAMDDLSKWILGR